MMIQWASNLLAKCKLDKFIIKYRIYHSMPSIMNTNEWRNLRNKGIRAIIMMLMQFILYAVLCGASIVILALVIMCFNPSFGTETVSESPSWFKIAPFIIGLISLIIVDLRLYTNIRIGHKIHMAMIAIKKQTNQIYLYDKSQYIIEHENPHNTLNK